MANSTTSSASTTRPNLTARLPSTSTLAQDARGTPSSPRTPLLGRSISSQFGSPSTFRSDQDDLIIYELGSRHLTAGFAGESRPRCLYLFGPEHGRRVGDFCAVEPGYQRKRRKLQREEVWGREYELYRCDLREVDLGLVEDKLERALRTVHADFLQLDQKPRKAVLALPSLLPTPLVEVALKVLFNHYAQPPAVTLLTTPLLVCVGAGLRNAFVVDVGWEECVVTAIGEYKEVCQRRSVRAGKRLTREMAKLLEEEAKNQTTTDSTMSNSDVSFEYAEEVTQRMAWCRSRDNTDEATSMIKLPSPSPSSQTSIHVSFLRLSKPAEAFFATEQGPDDDHNLPIPTLVYGVLLSLPVDLRAICVSRMVFTGGVSNMPGLKQRVLQELDRLISTRGWDPVHSYGSAQQHHDRILQERSANIAARRQQKEVNGDVPLSPAKKPIQEAIPHSERIHDDIYDNITLKAEREAGKGRVEVVKGVVRGVNSLGPWAGASLMSSLRVKGVHEIEREQKRDEWNL